MKLWGGICCTISTIHIPQRPYFKRKEWLIMSKMTKKPIKTKNKLGKIGLKFEKCKENLEKEQQFRKYSLIFPKIGNLSN
jgi:hypothetical protein